MTASVTAAPTQRTAGGFVHGGSAPRSSARSPALVLTGATSALPLMTFTVTGFTLVCLVLAACATREWARRLYLVPLLLCTAGSLAYFVSALVNETSLTAIDVPAFPAIALYIAGIAVLTRDVPDLTALLAGVSLGTIGFYLVIGTTLTADGTAADLWKYGLAPAVTALGLIVVAHSRHTHPASGCVVLIVLAAISVVLNYRSHALICIAAALLVMVDSLRRRPLPLVVKGVVAAGLGVASSVALSLAANSGLLGGALTAKVRLQASQHVPVLLAGRTEPPLSLTAIAQRPLLGWGDANALPASVFDRALQVAYRWGFDLSYPLQTLWRSADGEVSLHSILLGSWAEAGVVAAFAAAGLMVAGAGLVAHAHRVPPLAPLVMFLGIQALWDLLFSPWSYNMPLVFAVVVVLAVRLRSAR